MARMKVPVQRIVRDFQLPLSGSLEEQFFKQFAEVIRLSTPSLGITEPMASLRLLLPFLRLSTPSLGIT